MKKYVYVLLTMLLAYNFILAQTAKIENEPITPHMLTSGFITTNSVSTGLDIIPNGTYAYFCAKNIGNGDSILTADFQLISKPSGSAAAIEVINPTWIQLKPDLTGEYQIKLTITTSSGSNETTKSIYSANYVGVGNFGGVTTHYPNCMTCHQNSQKFLDIFNRWKVSGHANVFNQQIETSDHYSTSCMKCHTTGYDHNVATNNGGFDDIAAQLGWSYTAPSNAGKWDTLVAQYPGLVNLATIGCESCHGPGSEHTFGAYTDKIQISAKAGVCASCHDEPWRHNKYSEFENSAHSEAVWESTTGSNAKTNNLGDCIRCHDGVGFSNFTKGLITDATTWTEELNGTTITCAACHDPHGNSNTASVRNTPVGSDTLGNGYHYAEGGLGKLCMNCHKARQNNATYIKPTGTISSHWGPHHSTQADVLLGKNAAEFTSPFVSGNHKYATANACVTCHMVATADTGTVNRDKVGGHSWNLHNPESGYDHTTSCTPCHGPKNSFEDFTATMDYDLDGVIEPVNHEIDGLIANVKRQLPPAGQDTIILSQLTTLDQRKAYWNYMLIAYDGSRGMHNTAFAVDVLTKSFFALGGVVPVELVSFNADLEGNVITLTWITATETNNKGFQVERKSGNKWEAIDFVSGRGTTTEVVNYSFTDKLAGVNTDGTISYRLKQIDYDGTFQYTKEVSVNYLSGPKEFTLSQNYPNPFNPSTVIKYTLPSESNVKIIIYNIAGEIVKVLVNDVQSAGNHEATFSSTSSSLNISSGVYFYSLEANAVDGSQSFRQTKKMVLMK